MFPRFYITRSVPLSFIVRCVLTLSAPQFRNVYRKQSRGQVKHQQLTIDLLELGTAKKADDIIQEYKRLIKTMPRGNQYLLLYVLDLLSVFARKSDKNLMTASSESQCIRLHNIHGLNIIL